MTPERDAPRSGRADVERRRLGEAFLRSRIREPGRDPGEVEARQPRLIREGLAFGVRARDAVQIAVCRFRWSRRRRPRPRLASRRAMLSSSLLRPLDEAASSQVQAPPTKRATSAFAAGEVVEGVGVVELRLGRRGRSSACPRLRHRPRSSRRWIALFLIFAPVTAFFLIFAPVIAFFFTFLEVTALFFMSLPSTQPLHFTSPAAWAAAGPASNAANAEITTSAEKRSAELRCCLDHACLSPVQ